MNNFMYFITLLMILISVAFFTLLERKLLGFIHVRLGPNKVGLYGLFQPLGDAMKLFKKEDMSSFNGNSFLMGYSPFMGLVLMFMLWSFYYSYGMVLNYFWSWMVFFILISLTIFYLLLAGWSSGGSYSKLGSYRCSAQSVSYEVGMIFLLLSIIFLSMNFNFLTYFLSLGKEEGLYYSLMYMIMLFMMFLSESMRSPFDFAESESELVSGFNTEYSGGFFSLIFIGEYGFMLFYGMMISWLFFSIKFVFFFTLVFVILFIWVRGSFPRLRYDKMMSMMWKILLPVLFCFFIMFLCEQQL